RGAVKLDHHVGRFVLKHAATINHATAAVEHHDAVAFAAVNLGIADRGISMGGNEDAEYRTTRNVAVLDQRLAAGRQQQAAVFGVVNPAFAQHGASLGILDSHAGSGLAADPALLHFDCPLGNEDRAFTKSSFFLHRDLADKAQILDAAAFC